MDELIVATTIPLMVPDLGEIIQGVRVVRWLKRAGDEVELDEELVEVTTDKMDVMIPSPAAGRLVAIHVQPGDDAAVGALLGTIAPRGG